MSAPNVIPTMPNSPNKTEVIGGTYFVDAVGSIVMQSSNGRFSISALDPQGNGQVIVQASTSLSLQCMGAQFLIYNPSMPELQEAAEAEGEALEEATLAASVTGTGGDMSGVAEAEGESAAQEGAEEGEEEAEEAVPVEVVLNAGIEGNLTLHTAEAEAGPTILLTALGDAEQEPPLPPSSIQLSAGSASILITDGSITLRVGETVYVMTEIGIAEECVDVTRELDPEEGHSMNAGEAVWSLDYVGEQDEGPVHASEAEGIKAEDSSMTAEATVLLDTDSALVMTE